jgi:hypothetical protein
MGQIPERDHAGKIKRHDFRTAVVDRAVYTLFSAGRLRGATGFDSLVRRTNRLKQ